MNPILLWCSIFVGSLILLIKASDVFTENAEKLGRYVGIPSFIIGIAIVAMGTSLPELASSLVAVFDRHSEMVAATVIGSNIANVFLILGLTAILSKKITVRYDLLHVDLPMLIGSAMFLAFLFLDRVVTQFEAAVCILGLVVFLLHAVRIKGKEHGEIGESLHRNRKNIPIYRVILYLILSLVAIYYGARYTVESMIELSQLLHIGTVVLAIVPVAIGTSLPELVVSLMAIRRKHADIALGNIIGSNIFNIFGVIGIPGMFGSILVPQQLLTSGIPMLLAATLLVFFITQDKEVTEWEGWLLIMFYIVFLGQIVYFV